MIDWVHQYGKSWGACTRWMLKDTNEGYPSRDTIQKAYEGMHGGSGGVLSQHWPEVRVGESLKVANAMAMRPLIPESLVATMWATYVVHAPAKRRAHVLSMYLKRPIGLAEYWRLLDRAHTFLSARIESPEVLQQKCS